MDYGNLGTLLRFVNILEKTYYSFSTCELEYLAIYFTIQVKLYFYNIYLDQSFSQYLYF